MTPTKILDSSVFDFHSTSIIKPPFEQLKNMPLRYTRVTIDSRDRNQVAYPNPNDYVVEFEEIEDVISAEVVILQVPFSSYLIHSYNNSFEVDGTKINLEPSQYTKTSIVDELNSKLMPVNIVVSYQNEKDSYSFTGNSNFTFKFTNHLAKMLGFGEIQATYQSLNNVLQPLFRANFDVDKYIVMVIDTMSINVSSNSVLNKSTVLVSRGDSLLNTKSATTPIKKYFNPTIGRLYKLRVRFTDYYGNPYDFQNQDHRFDIVYESKRQLNRYSTFV
jgi:hypothetical protein